MTRCYRRRRQYVAPVLVAPSPLQPEVVALLARARGSDAAESAGREAYTDGSARLLGWVENGGRVVAVVDFVVTDSGTVRIRAIATDPACERTGLGRRLLSAVFAETQPVRVEAETDDEAVGFYVACGFTVTALGQKYPGVNRYLVVREHDR